MEGVDCRFTLLGNLEAIVESFVVDIANKRLPRLRLHNNLVWDNVTFDKDKGLQLTSTPTFTTISMDSLASLKKFSQILKVLSVVHSNVENNSHCTKRDLFYQEPKLFGRQSTLDKIIDNVTLMLHVPRTHLNIYASAKGLVAGNLQYMEPGGGLVDCNLSKSGIPIPAYIEEVTDMKSEAKFVLIVEKDASFQRILEGNFIKKCGPCILITGKGFPDMSSRVLVKVLWRLHIPIFCLVDADPHGIEILSVYKYGSKSLCHETYRLATPSVKWLGVLPSDIERLHIPRKVLLPMNKCDFKKARDLLSRKYITEHQEWMNEIQLMLDSKMKAEIQCLDSISPNFLVDVYLPNKLKVMGLV